MLQLTSSPPSMLGQVSNEITIIKSYIIFWELFNDSKAFGHAASLLLLVNYLKVNAIYCMPQLLRNCPLATRRVIF